MSKRLDQREFLLQHMTEDKKYGDILEEYPDIEAKQLTEWYDNDIELKPKIRRANQIFNNKKSLSKFAEFKKMGKREFFEWYEKELDNGCGYCGIKEEKLKKLFDKETNFLHTKRGRGRVLELERKDAETNEYSKDNCMLACYLCNNHKSDLISELDFKKYFSKNIREYLDDKYKELEKINIMTNTLYLADTLEKNYEDFFKEFTTLLNKEKIEFEIIPDTKDIWCRDFMPIFVKPNKLISYNYTPDYLEDDPSIRSDFNDINKEMKLHEEFTMVETDIVLDGGNVVKHKKSVIMTDKIYTENPTYTKEELEEKLKKYFEIEKLIIIPWEPCGDDVYGHADGMVRFVNEKTVLVNGFIEDYEKEFFSTLKENRLEYEMLNTEEWGYLNFLQLKNIIILPIFGENEDKKAEKIITKLYPDYHILTINASEIKKDGGVLNCITWTLD